MEPIISAIVLIAGAVLVLMALVYKKGLKKLGPLNNPVWAFVVGIVLVGAGAMYGGWDYISDFIEDEAPTGGITPGPSSGYQYATWDITPSAIITGGYNVDATLNSAKTVFTVPAMANLTGASEVLVELDNTTWENPRMQFVLKPLPWAGADADDLATIYFEVNNPDLTIETSTTGNYYLLTKTGGNRQAIWTVSGLTSYVEGSHTVLLTGNATITLDLTVNQDSAGRIENTYDPITLSITFHNGDWSWSKSYNIDFMLTNTWSWGS
jgi:hypothetical protein